MKESKIREYGVVKLHEARRCRFCRKQYFKGERMVRKRFNGSKNPINFVCFECEAKIKRGEIVGRRFEVGDKVRYLCNGTGNPDLHGMVGTVIFVDSRDYTVEFDQPFYDAITDYRAREIGIEPKFERGWFCREEHLEEV